MSAGEKRGKPVEIDQIERIVAAHCMTLKDAVELLEIVASICDMKTPNGAKEILQGFVEFLTQ